MTVLPDEPQSVPITIHTIWLGVTTIAGATVAFFTKRTIDEIDKKADKEDMDELKTDFRAFMQAQEQRHQQNSSRLDTIISTLGRRNP